MTVECEIPVESQKCSHSRAKGGILHGAAANIGPEELCSVPAFENPCPFDRGKSFASDLSALCGFP